MLMVLADAEMFTGFIQCCISLCPFTLSRVSFVGATSLELQQQLSQFVHVLFTQPSSRTF